MSFQYDFETGKFVELAVLLRVGEDEVGDVEMNGDGEDEEDEEVVVVVVAVEREREARRAAGDESNFAKRPLPPFSSKCLT